jgi:hypothetical protein
MANESNQRRQQSANLRVSGWRQRRRIEEGVKAIIDGNGNGIEEMKWQYQWLNNESEAMKAEKWRNAMKMKYQ